VGSQWKVFVGDVDLAMDEGALRRMSMKDKRRLGDEVAKKALRFGGSEPQAMYVFLDRDALAGIVVTMRSALSSSS
jgi:hypothetical protein